MVEMVEITVGDEAIHYVSEGLHMYEVQTCVHLLVGLHTSDQF